MIYWHFVHASTMWRMCRIFKCFLQIDWAALESIPGLLWINTCLYAHSSHALYFLPHDYSYDFIFLISPSMLIATITYLYSDGILLDLHYPLQRHTPYCSYSGAQTNCNQV